MRAAHLSDLHLTAGPRLADQTATLDAVITAALGESPDLWLLTGDLWGRTVPHVSTPAERSALYPAIVRMADAAPVVVVVGNHDSAADLAALPHLGGRFPILVIAEGGRHRVSTAAGVVNLYGLPYPTRSWLLRDTDATGEEARVATEAALVQLLTAWRHIIRARRASHPGEVHILAAHGEVEGVGVGDGEVVATGEIRFPRAALDDLGVDYGALGHIHTRQEAARRCYYSGSLWPTEHGGSGAAKGWHLVDVGIQPHELASAGRHHLDEGRAAVRVLFQPAPHRRFATLTYVWGEGAWIERPAALDVQAADVRVLLTVPEAFASSCPWPAELARIRAAGAERVQVDRRTIPSTRVRAPAVASAETPVDKLRAWWGTLDNPPSAAVQAAAVDALGEL